MVRSLLIAAAAAAFALTSAPIAHAQTPASGVPAAERQARWYSEQLLELARALGGAHYLRLSCTRSDYSWFSFMEGVLAREGAIGRRAMEDAFNDGFRRERARFARCSPQAAAMEAELRARGMRLADSLGAVHEE